MQQRIGTYTALAGGFVALLAAVLVGCVGTPAVPGDPVTASPYTPDQLVSARGSTNPALVRQVTPSPTPTPQSTPVRLKVRVWWPDELYPASGTSAETLLLSQFDGFQTTYSTYELEVRRKRSNGLGGILPTVRTASIVAPGALPDLTLMRRSDMITAATEGLVVPLDGLIPSDLVNGNLLGGARALGEIDGVLYGVPYALFIYHTLFRTSVFDAPLMTFDDVLAERPRYLFSAGLGTGSLVGETVLSQYLAAGGRLADELGTAALDRDPLLAVLRYYEQGVAEGLFDVTLRDYPGPDAYWADFVSGEANMIGVDSSTYLLHKDSVPNVGLAPIPTLDGSPMTLLDGWVWVMPTQDPDRQKQARAFLSWMMRVSQQSLFTEAMNILPSQQRALRLWEDEVYAEFAQTLVISAEVVPPGQRNSAAAQALQDSVIAVLDGTPAEAAADAALARLPRGGPSSGGE